MAIRGLPKALGMKNFKKSSSSEEAGGVLIPNADAKTGTPVKTSSLNSGGNSE